MVENAFGDRCTQNCHALGQPGGDSPTVEREVGCAGALHAPIVRIRRRANTKVTKSQPKVTEQLRTPQILFRDVRCEALNQPRIAISAVFAFNICSVWRKNDRHQAMFCHLRRFAHCGCPICSKRSEEPIECSASAGDFAGNGMVSGAMAGVAVGCRSRADAESRYSHGARRRVCLEPHGAE